MTYQPNPNQELAEFLASLAHDPVNFVIGCFPWGEGDLKGKWPEKWQLEELGYVRDRLKTPYEVIQSAIASGHDVGKSALICWLLLWAMATCADTRGIVTANTESQLRTKTWPEMSKWFRMFIAKHWFTLTATAIYSADPEHQKTWRIDCIPWSVINSEAFAGLHNKGKRIILAFDEASAIDDAIWEVSEGAMTDFETEILWFAFGNPTRNSGRFHACFNALRHRWHTAQIDSRTVSLSNKEVIRKQIEDYGEDSDFVRVRVKGEFPNASESQFISSDIVQAARCKRYGEGAYNFAPVILTLDNAWTGGDEIVIGKRQGLRFDIVATFQKNDDDMKIASILAQKEDEYQADAVFIDLGYGTGVFSAGKHMNRNWTLIAFGGASSDQGYLNLRAEMWAKTKEWLKAGGSIPDDAILCSDLCGPEGYVVPTGKNAGKVFIESKADMKARGLASPNRGDALVMSFAMPVMKKSALDRIGIPRQEKRYDPFEIFQSPTKQEPVYQPLNF